MNPKKDILPLFDDFSWDILGMQRSNGIMIDVPAMSKIVTGVIETRAVEIIGQEYAVQLPDHSRQYPDMTIEESGKRYAVDIKTAKMKSDTAITSMTLGSTRSYFKNPDDDMGYIKHPYNTYDEHWVLGFLYKWNPNASSKNLVDIQHVIAEEKWRLASRTYGSGTTANIGSHSSIDQLVSGDPLFDSEHAFEQYWRNQHA